MAMGTNALIIPGRGLLGTAPAHTPPPNPYTFDPNNPLTFDVDWILAHTSRENMIELSKDGGEQEAKGSWWTSDIYTRVSDITLSLVVNMLQLDKATFQAAFPSGSVTPAGGWAIESNIGLLERAVFVYARGASGSALAIYAPRVSLSVGDMPSFDLENFFEIQLSGTLNSALQTVTLEGETNTEVAVGKTAVFYPPIPLAA